MANIKRANFQQANLQSAKLGEVSLTNLNMSYLNMKNVDLTRATLDGKNLQKTSLQDANFEIASLQRANLTRTDLTKANLQRADLTDAKVYGWKIEKIDCTYAIMPDGEVYQPENFQPEIPTDNQQQTETIKPMTTRKIIKTDKAPDPVGPYNQAIAATGQMLFVSGQIAIDTRINQIVYTDDVTKQTEQVMANLEAILTEAGATWSNVVKTTVFLKDMNDFAAVNTVYAKYFDPENAPARACVEVARLPKDVLVEIDCIAVI
ncbi:MAG: Rid family detoxifying hydrolase [Microcoleaceae cyanobacterium MO_207.B10]|nr:Rid family detoxifying hydrolase [Microcoleaceae cyanobacterium MO_207.B10]